MSDAVVALPGGVGTLEELTEAITLKQLGLYRWTNYNSEYPWTFINHLLNFLNIWLQDNFLRYEHKGIWEIANTPEEVLAALSKKDSWHAGSAEELQKSNFQEFLFQ